jgi:hypothetical protein
MSWAAHEIELRRKPNQILIRLMDGQHELWPKADAAISDNGGLTVDILDILHFSGYVAQAAKQLCCPAQRIRLIRDRMQRILDGELKPCSISGLSKHPAAGTNLRGHITGRAIPI